MVLGNLACFTRMWMIPGPADYEESSPVPNTPLALYGRACYQQLGEAALAQIATPDTPNRWGFDTVLAQQKSGSQPKSTRCEVTHRHEA
jgi:hypothetical protein